MTLLVPGQLDDQIIGDRELGELFVVKNAETFNRPEAAFSWYFLILNAK